MLSFHKYDHPVHLLGFCDGSDEKSLLYKYTWKRSLDLHHTSNDLTWTRCLKIYVGMSCGIDHLHNLAGTKFKRIAS